MDPSKKIALLPRFLFLGLMLGFWSSNFLASYKVVLKDGRVLEARSKPVSMEGHYRFTDTNNQFQSISIQLVDLAATQSLNAKTEPKPAPARAQAAAICERHYVRCRCAGPKRSGRQTSP